MPLDALLRVGIAVDRDGARERGVCRSGKRGLVSRSVVFLSEEEGRGRRRCEVVGGVFSSQFSRPCVVLCVSEAEINTIELERTMMKKVSSGARGKYILGLPPLIRTIPDPASLPSPIVRIDREPKYVAQFQSDDADNKT
jgi:hypothetical protein